LSYANSELEGDLFAILRRKEVVLESPIY
jgi:hypothetical protein